MRRKRQYVNIMNILTNIEMTVIQTTVQQILKARTITRRKLVLIKEKVRNKSEINVSSFNNGE